MMYWIWKLLITFGCASLLITVINGAQLAARKCPDKDPNTLLDEKELLDKCKQTPVAEVCSGQGICHCGTCVCSQRQDPKELISGKFCECDNFNCPKNRGKLCSGIGSCQCGKCDCPGGTTGIACECQVGDRDCTNNILDITRIHHKRTTKPLPTSTFVSSLDDKKTNKEVDPSIIDERKQTTPSKQNPLNAKTGPQSTFGTNDKEITPSGKESAEDSNLDPTKQSESETTADAEEQSTLSSATTEQESDITTSDDQQTDSPSIESPATDTTSSARPTTKTTSTSSTTTSSPTTTASQSTSTTKFTTTTTTVPTSTQQKTTESTTTTEATTTTTSTTTESTTSTTTTSITTTLAPTTTTEITTTTPSTTKTQTTKRITTATKNQPVVAETTSGDYHVRMMQAEPERKTAIDLTPTDPQKSNWPDPTTNYEQVVQSVNGQSSDDGETTPNPKQATLERFMIFGSATCAILVIVFVSLAVINGLFATRADRPEFAYAAVRTVTDTV